ncbi:MAG: tRNA (adenosine(37)-N6)-dimethylallyltransferase MiaA [Candidatus Meridianibacter frigidus]|nr:MAG: tRNA (adenosine(37)-N6)-dimethylallyltransferase MiaA [Candidatus Eremiobacteraeota bacterium]
MQRGVLLLAGPTASGKTALAIRLAQEFDAEIVSADSRQVYAGMEIGTAAPTAAQRALAAHHLVGFLDPRERYSAARFVADAMHAIEDIHGRGKRAIVAGGTGFYMRALSGDVVLAPQYDQGVRDRLAREAQIHDTAFLYEWLSVRAPDRAAEMKVADRYRVLRALEVELAAPRALHRTEVLRTLGTLHLPILKLFLAPNESELQQRIEARTDAMLVSRLLEEAERIGLDAAAASAVGYPHALAYLTGWCTHAELRALLVRSTRRYAKRQYTWFRSESNMQWISPEDAHQQISTLARERLHWL